MLALGTLAIGGGEPRAAWVLAGLSAASLARGPVAGGPVRLGYIGVGGEGRVLLGTTALVVTGAFTSFTYITEYLTDVNGFAPETIGPRIPDGMPPEESARLALEATTATLKKAGVA